MVVVWGFLNLTFSVNLKRWTLGKIQDKINHYLEILFVKKISLDIVVYEVVAA